MLSPVMISTVNFAIAGTPGANRVLVATPQSTDELSFRRRRNLEVLPGSSATRQPFRDSLQAPQGIVRSDNPCIAVGQMSALPGSAPTRSWRWSTCAGRLSFGCHLLGGFDDFFDRALVHEGRFWQGVVLAFEDFLERAHGVGQWHEATGNAGELLGGEVRLGHESFDASSAGDSLAVLIAEFLDTEDGNDVLQLTVALQHALDFASSVV